MTVMADGGALKTNTFRRSDDDGRPACWETDVWCHDGRVVVALGDTEEESRSRALALATEHHAFLSSSARDRLKTVLSHAPGAQYLNAVDTTYAIKAIAEILLDRGDG